MALPAILKPKLVPGDEIGEERFGEFCLVGRVERLCFGDRDGTAAWWREESHRVLVVEFEIDEIFGVGDPQRHELDDTSRGLERQGDVKLDQMVGSLLHPVIGDRAEIHRLAGDLKRREITDLCEASGIFPGERREFSARDEFARLGGEPLRRERRVHLVEHPVVNDGRDFAVRRERDLAPHRHPDVWMGDRRPRRRETERKPGCPRPPIARPMIQRTRFSLRDPAAPLESKVRRLDGGASPPLVQRFLKQSSQT